MSSQPSSSTADRAEVLSRALGKSATRLRIEPRDLAVIIGVSEPVAARLMRGEKLLHVGTRAYGLATQLVRLERALLSMVGGDDHLAHGWLHTANRAFDEMRPIDLIRRTDGLKRIGAYLDAYSNT